MPTLTRALLLLCLLLPTPVWAAKPVLVCDQATDADAVFTYYACPFDTERAVTIIQFVAPIRGTPLVSIRGDYHTYAGSAGVIQGCISVQQTWVRSWGMRVKVFSTCPEEKYLVIELAVPHGG